jgi:NAD(P)-dependent dehydrogenase (short-subunit alcohol dehydrogenase family)
MQVALVTGASRGLGRALTLELAGRGWALSICARALAPLEAVAAELGSLGTPALITEADLRSPRDQERLVALTLERFGHIDLLINNASELGPTPLPYLADVSPDAFVDVLDVNLVAPFRISQSVIRTMLLRGSGLVINISSDAAGHGYPGWGAYAASKAGLESITRTWAAELEGTGVRMLSLDPGDMDTAMHRAALPDDDPSSLRRPEESALEVLAAGGILTPEPVP